MCSASVPRRGLGAGWLTQRLGFATPGSALASVAAAEGGGPGMRRGAVPTVGGGGETGSQTSAPGCSPASPLLLPGEGDGALSRRWRWQLKTPRVKCSTQVTRVSVEDEHKAVKASSCQRTFFDSCHFAAITRVKYRCSQLMSSCLKFAGNLCARC